MNTSESNDGMVIFEVDGTNCHRDDTRRPVSDKMRKFIEDRLDRAQKITRDWEEERHGKVNGLLPSKP